MENYEEYVKENNSRKNCSEEDELFFNEIESIYDVQVTVSAILGKSSMPINKLLRIGRGAVIELDRRVGDPVEVMVNNRVIARGEVVIVDEDRIGIAMTDIIKTDSRK